MTIESEHSVTAEELDNAPENGEGGDGSAPSERKSISLRRFLGDTLIFGLVDTFDRAIGFVLLPITTALMVPSQYGILSLYSTTNEILFYLISLGMLTSFFRHYTEANDAASRRKVFNVAFFTITAMSAVAALVMIPFYGLWTDLIFHGESVVFILMTVPATYMAVMIALGDSRLQADGRRWTFFGVNVLQTATVRGLSLILLYLNFGAIGWVIGAAVGQVLTISIMSFIVFRDVKPQFDREWARRMVPYGAILVPVALSHWVMQGGARYMMNFYLEDPKTQIGLYTVGERISQIMTMINLGFALGWRRFAFHNMHLPNASKILGSGVTLFLLITSFGLMGIVSLGDDLTRWMIRKEYWEGIRVIPYLTLAAFAWGVGEATNISLHKTNRTELLSGIYMVAAGASFILNLFLIPRYGIDGAAISLMICEIGKSFTIWIVSRRLFPLTIQYRRLALAAAVYLPTYLICETFFPQTTLFSSLAQVALVFSAPFVLVGVSLLIPSEREFVKEMFERVKEMIPSRA